MTRASPSDSFFDFPADLPVPQPLQDLLHVFPLLRQPCASVSGSLVFHAAALSTVARIFG